MPKSAGKHKEANQLSGTVVHNLIPIGENFALNINLGSKKPGTESYLQMYKFKAL